MGKPEIRVLLVEDDEDDYLITSELLAEIPGERFHLDWVASYHEALADIAQGGHDVYLIDYRLGLHDGLDLVREAIVRGCQAPMILLTGQGDTEVDLAAMRAGVADYLVKSQISAPILDRAIRYALERKANEDRLRRSEQRFRDLVNGLDAIVWEADALTFAFQFVSRRAEAILGYPTHEWLSGPEFWNRLIHPDDRVLAWTGYELTATLGRDEEFRHRVVAADGRTVWLRNNVHVVRDSHGRPERLRGVMVDITPAKEVEEALRASEARLANAQRLAHLGSWEYDLTRDVLHWSDETFRIFGRTPGVDTPTDEIFWGAVHPAEQELVRLAVQEALTLSGRLDLEHRIVRPDGSERTVSEYAEVLRDPAGYPVRLVGTVHDVTDRRQLEEQLRQSQKMEAVGRLAGGVAHDFNNMLAVISGYCELLLESSRLDPMLQPAMHEIKKAGERAAALTRQLLAFSRKSMLAPQVLDLNHVVEGMTGMLRRLIGEDIELELTREAELGRIKADPGQVTQVLLNLAVNARDAMPEGGVLRLSTANASLDAYNTAQSPDATPGEYVVLTIQDTGCGMDTPTLGRIFEPFFTTKGPGIGTGLGLATVYGIVTQSGGHIEVESELGKGSTFRVYLPRTDAHPREAEAGVSVPPRARGTGTILIVEDEEMLRGLVRSILEMNGYRVLDSPDAEHALPWLDAGNEPIDLLLTDVVMPGMSGPELARLALQQRPGLRVLFMSGYTDDVVLQHGMHESSTSFIGKPFTPDAIVKRVHEILSTKTNPPPA